MTSGEKAGGERERERERERESIWTSGEVEVSLAHDFFPPSPRLMVDVGRHTRLTPEQRQDSLLRFVDRVRGSEKASEVLSSWGLELERATVDLAGRLLPREQLVFGRGYRETVGPSADWTRTATGRPVLTPVNVVK